MKIFDGEKNNKGEDGVLGGKHFKGNIKLLKSGEIKNVKKGRQKGNESVFWVFDKQIFGKKIKANWADDKTEKNVGITKKI